MSVAGQSFSVYDECGDYITADRLLISTSRSNNMPKLTGVLETSLYIADGEHLARFYESLIGFARMFTDARICCCDHRRRPRLADSFKAAILAIVDAAR
jgi:hypothetical protein